MEAISGESERCGGCLSRQFTVRLARNNRDMNNGALDWIFVFVIIHHMDNMFGQRDSLHVSFRFRVITLIFLSLSGYNVADRLLL